MKHLLATSLLSLALLGGATASSLLIPVVPHAHAADASEQISTDSTQPDVPAQFGTVMSWIMSLFAWLVGAAALTLDWAVYFTVVNMGTYVKNLTAIGATWQILRNLGNIVLIFGFLAIGISVILNTERLGYGKKMLPTLLLVAVFLNFSLFISEAVIDTGNLFATQFFTQINGNSLPQLDSSGNLTTNGVALTAGNEGISNKIMAQLGLETTYGNFRINPDIAKGGHTWTVAFMGILLFIITAFVMFALALILIARFVALILLIIVAPIGFAGLVVPKLEGVAKSWWSTLFQQTITAPVLLLLLYVALAVITDANFLVCGNQCGNGWTGFINGGNLPGFASVMLSFLIAMGLLLAVIVVAKRMASFGASWATKMAGTATFGLTAWGMNRTLGRAGYLTSRRLRQSAAFNKFDAATGRVTTRVLDRAATSSFDIRGTGALKSLPYGGIDAGSAQKGGFAAARTTTIKEQEAAAKKIDEAFKDPDSKLAKANAERLAPLVEAVTTAENKQKGAAKEKSDLEKAVARLKRDPYLNRQITDNMSEEDKVKIYKSKEDLRTAQEKLRSSEDKLATADDDLTKATEARSKVEKEWKSKVSGSKEAYVSGLTSGPGRIIGLFAYGPGQAAAAANIKASLKDKSADQKLMEDIKKLTKETVKTEEATGKTGDVSTTSGGAISAAPASEAH